MKTRHVKASYVVGALLFIGFALPAGRSVGQGRPISVDELTRVLLSGGDVAGWDEFDVPRFVAGHYGARAAAAVTSILRLPPDRGTFYLQLEALTAAGYPKVGIPVEIILPFAHAVGFERLPPVMAEILRQRAVMALAGHPDPSLLSFWETIVQDSSPMIRQFAPLGMACTLGAAGADRVNSRRDDSHHVVREAVGHAESELRTRGSSARVCFGLPRDSVLILPGEATPEMLERARRFIGVLP